jgi:hypothetical protein
VQGLPNDFKSAGDLRSILLDCLRSDLESKHRPALYRAASRVDEILEHQRRETVKDE